MDFDIQIVHSVEEIGREAWDCLSGNRFFASYRWYRYGETVLADNKPIYIVLSLGGRHVACATFWLRRNEQLPVSSKTARRLMASLLRRRPLLLCKSPLVSASGLILPDPPLRDAALETIVHTAYDLARRHRASFLGCVYLGGHEAEYAGWPNTFAAVRVPGPGTRLVITWPDFESYLGHLSKSMRKDYRRHHNRATDLGITVKRHPVTKALNSNTLEQAMVLIQNVDKHHDSPPHPWAWSLLENAHTVDAVWLTAEIEDRLVGCGLLLGDRSARFLALLGLDYGVQYVYFQLFYAALRCVIEEGTLVLRGGSGAYEMKQRLGFQLEGNNHAVFAGIGPVFQKLGRWVATMV